MPVDLWTSDAFLDEATAWVAANAAGHGLALTGEREQPHARPWSSAIRYETDGGRLWFKVNGPGTAHEAALTGTLGRVVPALVPEVLAVDRGRGWSLMRDAGPVLRSLAPPEALWTRWEQVIAVYADAQRTLAAHTRELLADGVHEASPTTLPLLARELLEQLRELPEDQGGLSREDAERIAGALPAYDAACGELAESGIPVTVNHDDLHSANICWGEAGPRVIDWGDAVVGHPFSTMLSSLNSIAWHAKLDLEDRQVERVRDAYLAVFSDYADHDDLVRWVGLARRTGCITRALAWAAAFEGEPRSAQAAEDWPIRGWFLEILEP